MTFRDILAYLHPVDAEKDPGFRKEVERVSQRGLAVIGAINVGASLFLLAARFLILPDPATMPLRMAESAAVIAMGVFLLWISGRDAVAPKARALGMICGLLTDMLLTMFALSMCDPLTHADAFIPGEMTLVLLVGIAAFPIRPRDTFVMGIGMSSFYALAARTAESMQVPGAHLEPTYLLFMTTLTLVATGLTAVVYAERSQSYQRNQQTLRAERSLQETQRRAILAENAASLGRLAAALSHELNSPIGALSSAVDTLLLLSARQTTKPMDNERFVLLLNDLRKTIGDSANRLSDIVSRMQRISNLDGSEVQRINVNELLRDTVQMLESRIKPKARLELDLQDVPPLICKPVQLSGVFRNLINNSLDAVNGDGRLRVASRAVNDEIHVEIADNGHGMSAEDLKHIFDPNFRVSDGRVGTGNWSMFSSRQVVREHGGDIGIESSPGDGTRIHITFPVQQFSAHS
jgi:signal transduction histidine kinase